MAKGRQGFEADTRLICRQAFGQALKRAIEGLQALGLQAALEIDPKLQQGLDKQPLARRTTQLRGLQLIEPNADALAEPGLGIERLIQRQRTELPRQLEAL